MNQRSKMTSTTNQPTVTPAKPYPFVFVPYDADLNPGNPEDRKLILAASKETDDDKKIIVSIEKSKDFLQMVLTDASRFSWGGAGP